MKSAIVKTLVYADLFNQALSMAELHKYMVDQPISKKELSTVMMAGTDWVFSSEFDLFSVPGREALFKLKTRQLQVTRSKLAIAKRWLWLFKLVPWVKMVAVTGSVAGGSPQLNDDIDLMIITAPKRLWLSRFLITGTLTLLGQRRKPDDDPHDVANKLCLNMWLSEDHMECERQDIYVAGELSRMVPVFSRHQTYERYIGANLWIEKILPNFLSEVIDSKHGVQHEAVSRFLWCSRLLDWLNAHLESWQLRRMRPRTREVVTDELLMFHPKNYHADILERYEAALRRANI